MIGQVCARCILLKCAEKQCILCLLLYRRNNSDCSCKLSLLASCNCSGYRIYGINASHFLWDCGVCFAVVIDSYILLCPLCFRTYMQVFLVTLNL